MRRIATCHPTLSGKSGDDARPDLKRIHASREGAVAWDGIFILTIKFVDFCLNGQ
jgi:hypothetical protein